MTALLSILTGFSSPTALAQGRTLDSGRHPAIELTAYYTTQAQSMQNLLNQGADLLDQNQYAAALKIYQQIIQLDPSEPKGWIGQGFSLYGLERFPEAVKAFEQAV
ncbi:MAG: tetratricopeptide repeat protein, partial [Oscillatoriales cyanobacterium RM1_1_9]|nr:tetratricopeptide repeat protein [Oscillatoriales cyanobacterium RM1_1_9]